MEHEGSSLCPEKLTSGSSREPRCIQSMFSHNIALRKFSSFSSHLQPHPRDLFFPDFCSNILYAFLFSHMPVTRTSSPFLFDFNVLIMCVAMSTKVKVLHYVVFSSLCLLPPSLGPSIFFSILWSFVPIV